MYNHEQYYLKNQKYSDFLNTQQEKDFKKYTDSILAYTKTNDRILDVGCGTGIALEVLKRKTRKVYGVEISKPSVQRCLKKKLNCQFYNGRNLPFADKSFDLVSSYNVLEHVDEPLGFLNESSRVVKKNAIFIIVCPNFLSITNNYHYYTRGIPRKVLNLGVILKKLMFRKVDFEKMEPVVRENFQPDDDACNVTNPLDILRWAKSNNLKLEYWSSQPVYKTGIVNFLDRSFLRLFLGSLFMIFRKT